MEKNYYKTRDLGLASFLLTTGKLTLRGTQREGREVFFLFTPIEKAEELVQLYWSDKAPSVQPRHLFQSQRSLKDLIFSESSYE